MRKALPEDVQRLVTFMAEFYAEGGYPLNHQRAADAFTALLADEPACAGVVHSVGF
jgi:hypothetical protein